MLQIAMSMIEYKEVPNKFALFAKRQVEIASNNIMGNSAEEGGPSQHRYRNISITTGPDRIRTHVYTSEATSR